MIQGRTRSSAGSRADGASEWCADARSGWAQLSLHPPVPFTLDEQAAGYALVVPYAPARCDLAFGDGRPVRVRLRAGGLVMAEPGTRLRMGGVEPPFEFLRLLVAPERVRALAGQWVPGQAVALRNTGDLYDPGVAAGAQEIRRSLLADRLSQPAYLQSLADAMVTRLICLALGEGAAPPGREALSPAVLARVLGHIDASLGEPPAVEELAALAGLTRSHFSRAFQRMTGDPPQRYMLKRRICRARDLLSAGSAPVAEVAVRAGFSSQAHLSTAFRKEVGTTPARYRAAFRPGGGGVG